MNYCSICGGVGWTETGPCRHCSPAYTRVGAGDGCGTRVVNTAALEAEITRLTAKLAKAMEALRKIGDGHVLGAWVARTVLSELEDQ